ncbi:MAG: putative DNA binding domain-containing protein [Clostridiales bacterium]|jgi:predicted HTH transcriptional regulator|nr:putative DNA binding domain-containing protein [Clostridiales bacterium]
MVDFTRITEYRENNRLEAKKAVGGLPQSVWDTYSAFANTNGGVILLGVEELPDKSLNIVGLDNPEKVTADFWNTINNAQKVSRNILKDKHVRIFEYDGKRVVVIEVQRAERVDKPIYLNNDVWNAFRRNGEGDFRCSKESVQAMIRDNGNDTQDMLALENMPFSVFNYDTVRGYRNVMESTRPNHVWLSLDNDDFLLKLGAVRRGSDVKLHPTAAGLLMFGFEHEIVGEYPHYFLDYQEHYDAGLRWTDRITSTSGEWSGNLFEFYYKAYNKLVQNPSIKIPFKIEGLYRVDDTPVHKALREALANCLVNADYYGEGGVVIKSHADKMTLENPGGLRIRIEEAISGGYSNPRNSVLMKMFNLLDIGERAGSGVPNIYHVWKEQKWETPEIRERLDHIERTALLLPLKKVAVKSSGKKVAVKSSDKHNGSKTDAQKSSILRYAKEYRTVKSADLQAILNVGEQRVRKLLLELVTSGELVAEGSNRNRTYRLPD